MIYYSKEGIPIRFVNKEGVHILKQCNKGHPIIYFPGPICPVCNSFYLTEEGEYEKTN